AHRLGGDRIAVVELRGLHQVERPRPAIGRRLPLLGEPGDDLGRGADVLHQRVVERLLHHSDRPVVLDARVDRRHFLAADEDEDLPVADSLEGGDWRPANTRQDDQEHDESKRAMHVDLPGARAQKIPPPRAVENGGPVRYAAASWLVARSPPPKSSRSRSAPGSSAREAAAVRTTASSI